VILHQTSIRDLPKPNTICVNTSTTKNIILEQNFLPLCVNTPLPNTVTLQLLQVSQSPSLARHAYVPVFQQGWPPQRAWVNNWHLLSVRAPPCSTCVPRTILLNLRVPLTLRPQVHEGSWHYKTCNVHVVEYNVTLRRVLETIVAVETQYVLHILSMSVALGIWYALRMSRIILSSLVCLAVAYFSSLPHKLHGVLGEL
jgi:hypothetical protein